MSDPHMNVAVRQNLERARVARKAERTSDVGRFRGVYAGALVALVVGLAWLAFSLGPGELSSPGPLSHSHVTKGLECESCHLEPKDPARGSRALADPSRGAACVGCHERHPTTRPAHAELRETGALDCATCHRAHGGGEVVLVLPRGEAVVRRAGQEGTSVQVGALGGTKAISVPTPPAARCAGCHQPGSASDPVTRCLAPGASAAEAVTLCFDEHRGPAEASAAGDAERDAAYEAARSALAAAGSPARARPDSGWLGVLVAVGLGLVTSAWLRRKQLRAVPQDAASPVTPGGSALRRLPTIDESTCIGCNACVDACPYDVLQLERYVATVVRPADCCGLTLCEQRCPNGSLVVREGEPLFDRPRLSTDLQAETSPGVFLAGDVTGLPLIRNAINQGARAIEALAADLAAASGLEQGAALDVLIVGAGPAGLSAALGAEVAKLNYLVVEQGSVAESIRSFPRGKLVFDQPLSVPKIGDLWLEESSKEALLSKWRRIVREQRLRIEEGWRVVGVAPLDGGPPLGALQVELRAIDGRTRQIVTRRVVLAVGKRGSPRKLPIQVPDAALDRVHYHLADAQTFAGQRVLIVGLGDVAMETAVALGRQPGTQVTVAYRGAAFRRGKSRNVQELERLARGERVELLWSTEISAIDAVSQPGAGPAQGLAVRLSRAGAPLAGEWDAVFVMIGSVAPWELLKRFGVERAGAFAAADATQERPRAGS